MNHYEAVFISTPVLSNDEYTRTVKKYTELIEKAGGTVVFKEDWGIRQLAYPIEKKTTGFYTLLQFEVDPQFIRKFEVEFKSCVFLQPDLTNTGWLLQSNAEIN